jgi:hypothetical protein
MIKTGTEQEQTTKGRRKMERFSERTHSELQMELEKEKAGKWPTKNEPCYDCGSTIPSHHTPTCDMGGPGDSMDLEAQPGTQWWMGTRCAP